MYAYDFSGLLVPGLALLSGFVVGGALLAAVLSPGAQRRTARQHEVRPPSRSKAAPARRHAK